MSRRYFQDNYHKLVGMDKMKVKLHRVVGVVLALGFVSIALGKWENQVKREAIEIATKLGFSDVDDFEIIRTTYDAGLSNIVIVRSPFRRLSVTFSVDADESFEFSSFIIEEQDGKSRGLNFNPNLPIVSRESVLAKGEQLRKLFAMPASLTLDVEKWTEGKESAGKPAKGRGSVILYYFESPHGIPCQDGNALVFSVDHQTGELESVSVDRGYTYANPAGIISKEEAIQTAARHMKKQPDPSKLPILHYYRKKRGSNGSLNNKHLDLVYGIWFGRYQVIVDARTGEVLTMLTRSSNEDMLKKAASGLKEPHQSHASADEDHSIRSNQSASRWQSWMPWGAGVILVASVAGAVLSRRKS